MDKQKLKDVAVRALKTFAQAFISSISIDALFGEDEWTDIRSIMKYNPYITVISQTLKTFTCDGCNYFAVVDFPSGEFNEFYQHVMSYRINKISVTYAENTVA